MEYVCHYTSLDVLQKLLANSVSQDNGERQLVFYASSIFAMNDRQEFLHGYREMRKVLPLIEKELNVEKEFRISHMRKGMPEEEKYTEEFVNTISKTPYSPFAISFSRLRDDLSMWSMYGKQGKGICLVFEEWEYEVKSARNIFDSDVIVYNKLHAYDVCYGGIDEETSVFRVLKKHYQDYYNEVRCLSEREQIYKKQLEFWTGMCPVIAPIVKHRGFKHEQEVRLLKYKKDAAEVEFRVNNNGNVIPFIRVPLSLGLLKEIIIGPCSDKERVIRILGMMFQEYNISLDQVKISSSLIPYKNV